MIITQSVWLLLFQNKLRGLQRHLRVCVPRFCVPVLILPVVFVQKIRPCSGSHATSLCGGASPSTWPAWSTSPWPCSTPLAMMEMRVRIFIFFFFSFVLQQMISFGLFFFSSWLATKHQFCSSSYSKQHSLRKPEDGWGFAA